MQLEAGKTYKTRLGDTVLISHKVDMPGHYAFGRWHGYYSNGKSSYWTDNGHWLSTNREFMYDLVEEHITIET